MPVQDNVRPFNWLLHALRLDRTGRPILDYTTREDQRWTQLQLLAIRGSVLHLQRAPTVHLHATNTRTFRSAVVGRYVPAFSYVDAEGRLGPQGDIIMEDLTGDRTPLARWQRRHVELEYGVRVLEV